MGAKFERWKLKDKIEKTFQFKVIFWNKTRIEFEKKKKKFKGWCAFSMDSVKIEAYEREMKGKKIELATNQTSLSYTCYQKRKRTSKHIQWHDWIFFPPLQSTTFVAQMRWNGWKANVLMSVVHTLAAFHFLCVKR